MTNKSQDSGPGVMKLFIVLMSLSTLGFGVAAVVLYTLERKYGETLLAEQRSLESLQRDARNPDNMQYHAKANAGRGTTGRDLPEYLTQCVRLAGIPDNVIESSKTDIDSKPGYFETRSTYTLKGVVLPDLVRFLTRVEERRDDVYLKTLDLYRFIYAGDVPTCSAKAIFSVFIEK